VYYIPVTVDTPGNNSNPAVVAHVRTLTGFFFGGGDQLRIINSFYNDNARVPSPVLAAIRETLLATGGVVAGTSAGTDCQTDKVMITGGESYQGQFHDLLLPLPSLHLKKKNIFVYIESC
jgi:cyanophycinase